MNRTSLIRIAAPLALVFLLGACNKTTLSATPQEITVGTSCSLDGMTLADFPGPKGQIHYATGEPDFFATRQSFFPST
jgi:copper chaperone NosL